MNKTAKEKYGLFIFIALMVLFCYSMIAYIIPRTNFGGLMVLTTALFILYWLMTSKDFTKDHFAELLVLALLSRLVFLFAMPSLSDDYFRFIWDGCLTNYGVNPYLDIPASVNRIHAIALPPFMEDLKANMNSLPYFSPYPPVLQFVFFVSVKWGGYHLLADIMIFRILAVMADTGIVFAALKVLDHVKLPRRCVLLYALNPLVIIELTGNLHGEVFMIFFLLLSFYLLINHRYFLSAVFLGLAVSTKLIPLIFIPAIISMVGIKKGIVYGFITMFTLTASFFPFMNGVFIQHIAESIVYYFQKFEFNASIYYVLRWMGYDISGFNLIYLIGKVLPLCALILILYTAFYKRIEATAMFFDRLLFILLFYYLFSLIVHPWYITVLAGLSVFSSYRFPLAWSALVMLSYSTYLQTPYQEILWVTSLEYIILGLIIWWEIRKPEPLIKLIK